MLSLQAVIEAILFASDKPLNVDKLFVLLTEKLLNHPELADGCSWELNDRQQVKEAILELQQQYRQGAIELAEVASGYRFQIKRQFGPWAGLLQEDRPQKYSRALLETLSIIAYRQPITRGDIEDIRGVAVSTQIMKTLQEREWVRIVGHKDVPGRPALYATTRQFLDYFNLKTLDQLPPLAEVRDLDEIARSLELAEHPVSADQQPASEGAPDSAGSALEDAGNSDISQDPTLH